MKKRVPLQITFRGMEHSDAVAHHVAEKLDKLRRMEPRVIGCRVTLEALPTSTKGSLFTAHTRVSVPGGELVATHDAGRERSHDNVYVAIRDSMEAIRRQLRSYGGRRRDRRRRTVTGPRPIL